jgi:hypothetical protein
MSEKVEWLVCVFIVLVLSGDGTHVMSEESRHKKEKRGRRTAWRSNCERETVVTRLFIAAAAARYSRIRKFIIVVLSVGGSFKSVNGNRLVDVSRWWRKYRRLSWVVVMVRDGFGMGLTLNWTLNDHWWDLTTNWVMAETDHTRPHLNQPQKSLPNPSKPINLISQSHDWAPSSQISSSHLNSFNFITASNSSHLTFPPCASNPLAAAAAASSDTNLARTTIEHDL